VSDVRQIGASSLVAVGQSGVRRPVTRFGLLLEDPLQGREGEGLFERVALLAQTAEDAGFDSLWVNDRTADHRPGPDDGGGLEAYTLLGALATRTRTIRLGALPHDVDTRAPSMLAKIVTGIDVISHGRSVATLGSGLGADPAGDRLSEGLRVCRAVLDEEGIEFSGTFYDIHGALNRPRPVQVGGVPLVLFVHDRYPLRPETLASAVGYVDAVLIRGGASAVTDVVGVVRATARSHEGSSDPAPVIWVAGSPLRSEAGVDEELAPVLSTGVDGCIVSVGIDAPLEMIGDAALKLRAVADESQADS
jgi:alkanesulfonate monooxygenase SsuD/methylene tetrahydromethanopterin reductase-like flavin-dependent oxidoreductase (luciferase family)